MSKLKNKAINSIMWTSIHSIVNLITTPLLLILKARYLNPAEFGVLSIINIFMMIVKVFENTGLNKAIVQKENISKDEESSLLIFQMILCIVLTILIFLISPLFANIFAMSSLTSLLPIMSFTILFSGPTIILTAFLEKKLQFKEISIIQIIRYVLLFVSTAIFFVVFDLGLLGVVLGRVVESVIGAISIIFITYKNKLFRFSFHYSFSDVQYYLRFGVGVFSKDILTQVTNHMDEIIIGYFLSAEVLGYYYFAKNTLGQLRAMVSGALSKVMLPLLSQVKNNLTQLTNVYKKISKYLSAVSFPVFIGLATTSHLFIPIFFGNEWLVSNDFFIIISIASILNFIITNLSTSLLYSINRPYLVLKIDLYVNGFYVLLLFLLSWLNTGIYSIVFLYAIYLVFKPIILQLFANKYLHFTFKNYISLFKVSILASIMMMIFVIFSQIILFPDFNNLWSLILSIIIGVTVYFGIYFLIDKDTMFEIINLIRK